MTSPRSVGDKAVNAEDQTTFYDGEEPAYERQNEIRTERENPRRDPSVNSSHVHGANSRHKKQVAVQGEIV